MAKKETQPNPLEGGKGRIDEVDQSKGIFPAGVPHPPAAQPRSPGSIGGGSYEESGRGGVEFPHGPIGPRAPVDEPVHEPEASVDVEKPGESKEPAGALPPHEREKKA